MFILFRRVHWHLKFNRQRKKILMTIMVQKDIQDELLYNRNKPKKKIECTSII